MWAGAPSWCRPTWPTGLGGGWRRSPRCRRCWGVTVDARHAILFEPVVIGPKTLPNRFYQVPHASGFGSVQPRTQAAFRAVKAEGGWGGVCVEYAPVAADADETPAVAADIWDEADARALGLTAEAI